MKPIATKEDVITYDAALGAILESFVESLAFAAAHDVMQPGHAFKYLELGKALMHMQLSARHSYPQYFSDEPHTCGKHKSLPTFAPGADFSIAGLLAALGEDEAEG